MFLELFGVSRRLLLAPPTRKMFLELSDFARNVVDPKNVLGPIGCEPAPPNRAPNPKNIPGPKSQTPSSGSSKNDLGAIPRDARGRQRRRLTLVQQKSTSPQPEMRELRQYIETAPPDAAVAPQSDRSVQADRIPRKWEARSRCQTRVGSSSINCDLNRDELIKVAARANYTGLDICATAPIHFVIANSSIAINRKSELWAKNDLKLNWVSP